MKHLILFIILTLAFSAKANAQFTSIKMPDNKVIDVFIANEYLAAKYEANGRCSKEDTIKAMLHYSIRNRYAFLSKYRAYFKAFEKIYDELLFEYLETCNYDFLMRGIGLGYSWNREGTSNIIDDIYYHMNLAIDAEKKVIKTIAAGTTQYIPELAEICLEELEKAVVEKDNKWDNWYKWYQHLYKHEHNKDNLLKLDSIMKAKNYFDLPYYEDKQNKLMQERVWNK